MHAEAYSKHSCAGMEQQQYVDCDWEKRVKWMQANATSIGVVDRHSKQVIQVYE